MLHYKLICSFKYKSHHLYHIQPRYFAMFTSLQRYIPLFENYLASGNKTDFINSRNDPNERTLLELLTTPITSIDTFKEKMQKINLNYQIQNELVDYKLFSQIQNAKELKNQDPLYIYLKQKYSSGNFDYSRPSVLNSEVPKEGDHKSSDSEIVLPNTLEEYLESKRSTNPNLIRSINDYAFSKLSHQTLQGLSLADKEYVLDKFATIFHLQSHFLSKFLIDFERQKRKTNDNYRLPTKILSCLTKEQLITLGKTYHKHQAFNNQDYIELWFNQLYAETIRKHVENSSLFTKTQHQNKRNAFKQIVNELEDKINYNIIKRYINKFKSEILNLDILVNDPSLLRLIDYLQTSQVGFQLNNVERTFYDELRKTQRQLVQEPRMRYKLQVDKKNPNTFVEEYIELLFKKNNEVEPIINKLSIFIDDKYLRKTSVKIRLYKGEAIANVNDYFTQQQIQSMKDRKQIKILSSNPKKYRVQDDVNLEVEIKNVKKIKVKVYVINLEKHLLGDSSNCIIDDQIDLSFLIPTAEDIYQNATSNPFKIEKTNINLNKIIPKNMGVYIVDLQGETVTSRAVIRKGTIICVDTFTEAGQQFSFFDQNGRPLTEKDDIKVWIRGQLTKLKDNKAFVSYADKSEYGNIVAAVGDYAESFQKKFQQEKYKFEVGYIYNSESFIVGRKAKVILHGRLSLYEKSVSLQLLKNTKITAVVTNNQNIQTSFSFQIEKWSNSEDQIIEFPIQAYTKSIIIDVESKITLLNKKEIILNSSKSINIDLGENTTNFLDFYLQQDDKHNYKLALLGANGQPISNADVNVSLNIIGVEEIQRRQVKTNSEGVINLGQLAIVSRLIAEINNSESNILKSWQIDHTQNSFNYNKTIHFKLGQALTLPISKKWKKGDVLLLRTFDKYYVEDLTSHLHLQNGKLKLPVINQEGYYILKLLPLDRTIEIVTLKNHKWEDDSVQNQKIYDEADGIVYEINKNIYQNIAIQDAKFENKQDHINAQLTLNLDELPEELHKEVRVHVLANNYIANDIKDAFNPESFNVQANLSQHYVQAKRSAYYSNKTFSQQGAYVWNRQAKNEQLIGNNLEKPSIFLKRILVRETTQKNEQLYNEGKFIEECAVMDADPNIRERFRQRGPGSSRSVKSGASLNSHNNFLLITGDLSRNLNGRTLNIEIPNGYNNIEVYVLTPKTALKSLFSLGYISPHQKKDLRHSGLQKTEENYGWTMSRQINALKVNQKRTVSRNSQWRTVGLIDIFEFANNRRIRIFDWSSHLLNWNSYSEEKKREIYDKQCCHQLNTFIKFKDPKFFTEVVAAFIRNKIQKTIVDLCLLNDPNYIQYITLSKLNGLNAFEKALLVHTLTVNEQSDVARSIVESMQLVQKSIKRNYEQYKNSFDTIINAKETEQKQKKQLDENRKKLEQMKMKRMCRSKPSQQVELRQAPMNLKMMDVRAQRMEQKKAFVPVESTKQYTERTYYNIKDYKREAPRLVLPSRFWAEVARNFLQGRTEVVSETFMYLRTPVDFILASSFIPSDSSSNYQLSNAGENYEIHPKSPMLLYVKQVKKLEYLKKFGVLINQRFFDPNNRKAYEQDGTEYDKQVEEFIVKKCYICQTVVNNTSGTPLELQVLMDIPKGTIRLRSHDYTQIINIRIQPYSSQSYQRYFYIPEEGEYEICPSNASRGSTIIAKANTIPAIVAKKSWSINKLESFEDIMRSGDKNQVISFLQKKNIFDHNVFKPSEILWMLKDKAFYHKVIEILRKRNYFIYQIWEFGFLHLDLQAIQEFISQQSSSQTTFAPVCFEYFPYYSSRTHQFANESKSTIRNIQFKQTYLRFLVGSIIGLRQESFEVSYCYYLILQDRLRDANEIIKNMTPEKLQANQVQFDYMKCFLDLSLNAPNFTIARQTLKKYDNYPIQSWRKLFADAKNTIQAQDNDFAAQIENQNHEAFQTQVIQQASQFKIIQPTDTTIQIQIFEINLELYFSQYPFIEIKTFTSVKPSIVKRIEPSKETKENIIKRSDFEGLKDATVQITEFKQGLPPKTVSSFWWTNSDIKVKLNQNQGTLQVYLNKKRLPGAYVKVFSDKQLNQEFYRDGYTDMTGTFRYAMSDLDGIKQFSILVMTDKGGVIQRVNPPSKLGSY